MKKKKKVFVSLLTSLALTTTLFTTTMTPTQATTTDSLSYKLEKPSLLKDFEKLKINGTWTYDKKTETYGFALAWLPLAEGYKIYRKADDGDYALLKTIDKGHSVYYKDTTIEFGKVYTYQFSYIYHGKEYKLPREIKTDYQKDTDKDGITDIEEKKIGTQYLIPDSDLDGLKDGFEIIGTKTDPLKYDTDGNRKNDAKEDSDKDGLTNSKEQKLNTNPSSDDTDGDTLKDGIEVEKGTDPTKRDTDGDGLEDGFEVDNGFNPLKTDSDGDGIADSDEIIIKETTIEEIEKDESVTPSVKLETKAGEAATTTITNMEGIYSAIDESTPGYIGAPFDFKTKAEFENAQMEFSYDKSLNGESFEPAIFYYNEETGMLEKVENQTWDKETGIVSANVNHFSTYVLLNNMEWEEAWNRYMEVPILGNESDGKKQYIDMVFAIDSSGSMDWNDPSDLRKESAKQFVEKLREQDKAAVVDFDDGARTLVSLTTNHEEVQYQIDTIDSDGGTDLYVGLNQAVDEVIKGDDTHKRFVIFLTDGDGTWREQALTKAKDNNVTVYTIGLGSGVNQSLLKRIAEETGGKYFFASSALDLGDIHDDVAEDTIPVDKDEDGLPDKVELSGYRTEAGEWIYTKSEQHPDGLDFENPDTDGDGLKDGEEAGQIIPGSNPYYYTHSNPLKKDTDMDGLNDKASDSCVAKTDVTECKDSRPKVYDINNYIATLIADISYVNLETFDYDGYNVDMYYATGEMESLLKNKLSGNHADRDKTDDVKGWDAVKGYLKGWKVVSAEDSNWYDSGLGALALKKGDQIIVGLRGTEDLPDFVADLAIAVFVDNLQISAARDFTNELILDYPDANFTFTGHSLGGFLTQDVAYHMIENKIGESAFWWSTELEIAKIIDNNKNIHKKSYTFNAAPLRLSFDADVIPPLDLISDKYDDEIYNFSIDGDPLTKIVELGLAYRVGKDVPNLPYTAGGNWVDPHSLKYFYEHFE